MPESSFEVLIDLYDSDRPKINKVLAALRRMMGQRRDIDGFRSEIANRFAEAGYVVDVRVYQDEDETVDKDSQVFGFGITIVDRVHPESEFDHDQQAHEVQHDLLGVRGETAGSTSVGLGGMKTQSGLWLPK